MNRHLALAALTAAHDAANAAADAAEAFYVAASLYLQISEKAAFAMAIQFTPEHDDAFAAYEVASSILDAALQAVCEANGASNVVHSALCAAKAAQEVTA